MKIAICDDEKIFIEKACTYIKAAVKKHGRECFIKTFNTGESLIKACRKEKFDAIFLDIAMPKINGFDVAKELMKINPEINVVFVSNKSSLVFSSYEYNPLWFVPKSHLPFLETAINKVIRKIDTESIEKSLMSVKIEKNIVIRLDLKKVAYIQSTAHYLNIHYIDDAKPSESYRSSLDRIEELLKERFFVRCHNRYLVNCRNISSIKSNVCILQNEESIPVSRNKIAETKLHFQNYLRSM